MPVDRHRSSAAVVAGGFILIAGAISSSTAAQAFADDFPTALRQLQALSSVASAGVTIDEYQRRVLDAKIVVDRYLAKPDRDDARRSAVRQALGSYVGASSAWRYSITGSGGPRANDDCPPAATFIRRIAATEREQHERAIAKIDRSQPQGGTSAFEERLRNLEQVRNERLAIAKAAREVYSSLVPLYWECAKAWTRAAEGGAAPRWPIIPEPPPTTAPPASDAAAADRHLRGVLERDGTPNAKCKTKQYGTSSVTVCE